MNTTVWYITDEKPGHRNQLLGLQEALERRQGWTGHWLSVVDEPLSWADLLRGKHPHRGPVPDLVVGAGHRTHTTLLTLKRHYGAYAVVLMKPSLPISWFDAAVIPRHDCDGENRPSVLLTEGVLNKIVPSPESARKPDLGLMLIGGKSRHFEFDSADLCSQIHALIEADPGRHWLLSDSRRTPADFMARLRGGCPEQLTLFAHTETGSDWLGQQMASASSIWVSPDSVSMIYEALTSGAPVGLFSMPPGPTSTRVARGIDQLLAAGRISRFKRESPRQTPPPSAGQLWEADRTASWLIDRYRQIR